MRVSAKHTLFSFSSASPLSRPGGAHPRPPLIPPYHHCVGGRGGPGAQTNPMASSNGASWAPVPDGVHQILYLLTEGGKPGADQARVSGQWWWL